ncbi:MAG: hypothetical protein HY619_04620 [Thaumarchaeota archaeon]|nr:hypothetical protein [Nitrososphaerota archaeon]
MEPRPILASEPTVVRIVSFLRMMLNSNRAVEDFVERSFKSATPEVIRYWIREDIRLIPDTTRKLYFEHPLIRPIFKTLVKKHWQLIEQYLSKPDEVMEKMNELYPENKKILESEEARQHIKKELKEAYGLFYGLLHGKSIDDRVGMSNGNSIQIHL